MKSKSCYLYTRVSISMQVDGYSLTRNGESCADTLNFRR